jgi:Cobalamin synthesis protein cobW C-terminal domain
VPVPVLGTGQLEKVDGWLRAVLWEHQLPHAASATPFEIHRLKGRLLLRNGEIKMIQGVREIFEILGVPETSASKGSSAHGKIVIIGRHVRDVDFAESLTRILQATRSP